MKSNGPSTEPWGTPWTGAHYEDWLLTTTLISLLLRNALMQFITLLPKPACSFVNNRLCGTVSKWSVASAPVGLLYVLNWQQLLLNCCKAVFATSHSAVQCSVKYYCLYHWITSTLVLWMAWRWNMMRVTTSSVHSARFRLQKRRERTLLCFTLRCAPLRRTWTKSTVVLSCILVVVPLS